MNPREVATIRELAAQVAGIAALPVQDETRRLWRALNDLRPERPMVMIDQVPWNEMSYDDELTVVSTDAFAQRIETDLRRTLYAWRYFRVDMVVEPVVYVPKTIRTTGFGVEMDERTIAWEEGNPVLAHEYHDVLRTDEDVAMICAPEVSLDEEATAADEARAHELLDGILQVQMQGWTGSFELWDDVVYWRGAETVLYDLVDRPDHMHEIARRYTAARLAMLDSLEQKGLLGYSQPRIHCTGAWTDALPAPGFDRARPRAKDNWTYGMSQLLASVSKSMYEEFEIGYVSQWHARFGLTYYGCCDPLHDRIDLIRRIPNVRKISMSAWADVEKGAEAIGRDFVFSRKPNPAHVAMDVFEPEAVEADLRRTVAACRANDCPLEITLKDISTVRHQPQRLSEWAAIADRVIGP
jgi:hypothetical protein